jgi:hypothetical protein
MNFDLSPFSILTTGLYIIAIGVIGRIVFKMFHTIDDGGVYMSDFVIGAGFGIAFVAVTFL